MKMQWIRPVLVATVLALPGVLMNQTPKSDAATQAPTKITQSLAIAMSESTGHVFVLQSYVALTGNAGPQASWVKMLDARTSKFLRVVPVGTDGIRLLTNERTNRVFVIHGGYSPQSHTIVTTLDARTGTILRRTECGTGSVLGPVLAPRLNRLFLVTNGPQAFRLHELDAASGKHLREVAFVQTPGVVLSERAGLLYAPGPAVTVYNLHTLKQVARLSVQFASPSVTPDEANNRVLIVNGKGFDRLDVFSTKTWKHIASRPLGNGMIGSVVVTTNTVFAVSGGLLKGQTPTSDGTVWSLDRQSYRILRQVQVGAQAGATTFDASTSHLFVASGNHVKGGITSGMAGLISTINTRTGARVAEAAIPSIVLYQLELDRKDGLVYANAYGSLGTRHVRVDVVVVNAKTGAIMRTVDLGTGPHA